MHHVERLSSQAVESALHTGGQERLWSHLVDEPWEFRLLKGPTDHGERAPESMGQTLWGTVPLCDREGHLLKDVRH